MNSSLWEEFHLVKFLLDKSPLEKIGFIVNTIKILRGEKTALMNISE